MKVLEVTKLTKIWIKLNKTNYFEKYVDEILLCKKTINCFIKSECEVMK